MQVATAVRIGSLDRPGPVEGAVCYGVLGPSRRDATVIVPPVDVVVILSSTGDIHGTVFSQLGMR